MGDLYNSDTYTFSELRKKHESFAAPSYRIIVAGKNVADDMGYYAESVSVTQTIKAKSGSCRFDIVGAYDLKASGFKSGFDSSFPLGAKVEVFLGYIKTVLVFKGFIGDVSFSFNETSPPKATISCFDVRTLMMQGRQNIALDKAKFETVTEQIFSYYNSFIEFKNDCKQSHNKEENFNQNCNDFDYVNSYARARGHDFFVLGDKAYLQEIYAEKSPLITLEWGESLLSFSCSRSYSAVKVEGTLANYSEGEPITESAETEKPAYKQVQLTNKPVVFRLDTSGVKNAEDLKTVVGSETKMRELKSTGGTAKCIGIPELIPGRFVDFSNIDKNLLDGKLFVSEVTHELSADGYTTTLDFSCADESGEAGEVITCAHGDDKILSITSRKVVDNKYDDEHPACVKLDVPGQEGTTDWVRVVMPFVGKDYGVYNMPEIGDEVVVAYCDGDINKPIVIGGLYNKQMSPPANMKDDENNIKCIKTKAGHTVQFVDTKDKSFIEVITAGKLTIKLDDEAKTVTLSDSGGDNKILLNEKDGEIAFSAKNKISLKAGGATLTLDGQGKSAEIKADTVTVKPSQTLTLGGNQIKVDGQQLQIKGQTVALEAGAQLELKSSGMASLKGSMVKIN